MTDRIAQQVFGLLFENSPDAAFVVERTHWRVVSANLVAVDMFARSFDQLSKMALQELSYEPERDLTQPGHYEDVAFKRSDDYPVYVALQVAHLETVEYGPVAAFMARDVSERRLLEDELQAKHTEMVNGLERLSLASAATKAKVRLPVRLAVSSPQYAPSVNTVACATCSMRSKPYTSVRPSAIIA